MPEFSEAEKRIIFNLLDELVGSKRLAEQKAKVILNNIQRRIRATGSRNLTSYLKYLNDHPEEQPYLISSLTIHTTHWFREPDSLDAFETWLSSYRSKGPIKGLSVACSTGQETYSLALILAEKGHSFDLYGIDIDPISIKTAQKAVYLKSDLEGFHFKYRPWLMYGSGRTKDYFTLSNEIRNHCHFEVRSIDAIKKTSQEFDFIFCRNVMIYMSDEAIVDAVNNFCRKLRDSGLLALGVSESLAQLPSSLSKVDTAIYQKQAALGEMQHGALNGRILLMNDSGDDRTFESLFGLWKLPFETVCFADYEGVLNSNNDFRLTVIQGPVDRLKAAIKVLEASQQVLPTIICDHEILEKNLMIDLARQRPVEFISKQATAVEKQNLRRFALSFLEKLVPTLLVVDDEEDILEYYKEFLEQSDINVVAFTSPLEALQYASSHLIDGILTDYHMPSFDGLELINRVRREHPELPVLMVSGYANGKDEKFKLRNFRLIEKPVDEGTLKDAVHRLVQPRTLEVAVDFFQQSHFAAIFIGASTGGPETLRRVLTGIEGDFPPILIVQHILMNYQRKFFQELCKDLGFQHREVDAKVALQQSCVYFSAPSQHLVVLEEQGKLFASPYNQDDGSGHCPSVNQLFLSGSQVSAPCLGILLTGMGKDGSSALKIMRDAGHTTIAQNKDAVVFGMPKKAIEIGAAVYVYSDWEIQKIFNILSHSYRKAS